MIIDPADNDFTPTKRYLVQIPGTGIFHVDSFAELTADLWPEYGQIPDTETDENEVARQLILAKLSLDFMRLYRAQREMEGAAAPPIVVEAGVDYAPYTDIPLPASSNERLVIYWENLDEVLLLAQKLTLPKRKEYLLVLPAHEPEPLFRALGLAGLVEINDLETERGKIK